MSKKHKNNKRQTFKEACEELKNEKVPVYQEPETPEKYIPIPNEPSINKQKFKWKFSEQFCDMSNNQYGWHKANPNMLFFSAIEKLQFYENLTWNDVKRHPGAHFHEVPFDKLTKGTKNKISDFLHSENGDILCQLACKKKHRIIGVKQGDVFYPVWNDEEHNVYPM